MTQPNNFVCGLQFNLLHTAQGFLNKGKTGETNHNAVNTTLNVINVITVDVDESPTKGLSNFMLLAFVVIFEVRCS